MEKFILMGVMGIFGLCFTIFMLFFMAAVSATVFYFVWNTLAPIYFVTYLPAVFMHIPWWHCFLFMYLLGLLRSRGVSVENKN